MRRGFLSLFFRFLQTGFFLGASVGCSVRALLCEQLGLDEEYVLQRITTIFLDGKPVDDIDSAIVRDGATLSLSAAMPGLVGAAMRRGGAFASLRSSITANKRDVSVSRGAGFIRLKLFNMVMRELGPEFLKKGVVIRSPELVDFFKEQPEAFWQRVPMIGLNGAAVDRRMLTDGVLSLSAAEALPPGTPGYPRSGSWVRATGHPGAPAKRVEGVPFSDWMTLSVVSDSEEHCP
ncbi:MAG TPA: hypothetical protein VKF36_10185 [Syntrophorhabdales bacterium]|nr:hypothetical protein [Syntrophorhabdales bacterium]